MNSRIRWTLSVIALIAVMINLSVIFHKGGYIFGEADWFLVDHNTTERTFWNKILCPHQQDATKYLAREISHVIEHIDCKFIHWCVLRGNPHLLSICTYAFFAGISLLFWAWVESTKLNRWIGILLIGLFWTAPPIFMGGVFMRPGHAMATLFGLVLMASSRYISTHKLSNWGRVAAFLIVFTTSLLATWADRQGLFLVCSVGLFLLVLRPVENRWIQFSAAASGVVLHTIHNVLIGPALMAKHTWFTADLSFQSKPAKAAIAHLTQKLPDGIFISLDNLRLLFGNLPYGLSIGLLVAICAVMGRRWWIPALWFFLIAVMNTMVFYEQTALNWVDVQSIYYHILPTATLLALVGYVLTQKSHVFVKWALTLLILSNLMALPQHYRNRNRGHMSGYIDGTKYWFKALEDLAKEPNGPGPFVNRYDIKNHSKHQGFDHIIKNPLAYRNGLTSKEFVESSQYYNWLRSEKGLDFIQSK